MSKILKEVVRTNRKKWPHVLLDDRDTLIIDEVEILNIWSSYMTAQSKDPRPNDIELSHLEACPQIILSELRKAIVTSKTKEQARSSNNTLVELL